MPDQKRIVIVGGVAGGASAATRARRLSEDAEVLLIERGSHISYANCGLPYHVGGVIPERDRLLVQTPEALHAMYRIDVRTETEAVGIDREQKELLVRRLPDGAEERIPYDRLILSPGAEAFRPPIPGSEDSRVRTLRSLADMDAILKLLQEQKPERALIIGGGYIGLEMAEALRERGIGVTLVELAPQVMGPLDPEMAAPLHQQLRLHGVDLRLGSSVVRFEAGAETLSAHLSTGERVECGMALLAIGVRPETTLARAAGLTLGERGGILVDEHLRTSDPDIFAVGDAVEVRDLVGGFQTLIPLAGPANRQGRIAAENALGRESVYRATQGTGICKVFDLAAGMTGMNEKGLRRAGRAYEKVYVHPAHHAGYYPGAAPLSIKLLFDPEDGKILGAQAVGAQGVDKRIDVLAVALRAGMTVFDLESLELAYAPPYGSAKDPVNYAGFVAANVLRGDVSLCHVPDVLQPRPDQLLLDVRRPVETAAGMIPGAVNIPVQELRRRQGELPRDKEILVYCQVGMRGYVACRLLEQKGFRCRNLSGGYRTYMMATGSEDAPVKGAGEMKDDTGAGVRAPEPAEPAKTVKLVDACGLQCPGPIMRVASELQPLDAGEAIDIVATDPAFTQDIAAWCQSTGNTLRAVTPENGRYRATVVKGGGAAPAAALPAGKKKTMVVFSGDFDRAMAAFIIANGAAAMGSEVTMFFTFWGLNILRKPQPVAVRKNLVERMFGAMMPRGAERLALSRMNMGGMGLAMIKGIMRKKKVSSLPELIESARRAGVRLVACAMSMELMGIKQEELIDGVEEGGVAAYLGAAEGGNVNLFI